MYPNNMTSPDGLEIAVSIALSILDPPGNYQARYNICNSLCVCNPVLCVMLDGLILGRWVFAVDVIRGD